MGFMKTNNRTIYAELKDGAYTPISDQMSELTLSFKLADENEIDIPDFANRGKSDDWSIPSFMEKR